MAGTDRWQAAFERLQKIARDAAAADQPVLQDGDVPVRDALKAIDAILELDNLPSKIWHALTNLKAFLSTPTAGVTPAPDAAPVMGGDAQGLCDTTLTQRFANPNCQCETYEGNLGPCKTFEAGQNGHCVYCDHEASCHLAAPPKPAPDAMREVLADAKHLLSGGYCSPSLRVTNFSRVHQSLRNLVEAIEALLSLAPGDGVGEPTKARDRNTCGTCMGRGYSNHPDSGEICQTCNGSGASSAPSDAGAAEPVGWPDPVVTNPDIAEPTGIPYIDSLLHRLLDAQQDINLEANESMSQELSDASGLINEVETAIRKLVAAPPVRGDRETLRKEIVRLTNELLSPDWIPETVEKFANDILSIVSLPSAPVSGRDAVIETLESIADWCNTERTKIGAIDGYDYRSGEEFGLRCAEIEIKKRLSNPDHSSTNNSPGEGAEGKEVKLSKAKLEFLRMHLRRDLAKNGFLTKFGARKTWIFIRACSNVGLIEIIDPDNRFPYTWAGTKITDVGRAALSQPASEKE
jgi:hypothetical protein